MAEAWTVPASLPSATAVDRPAPAVVVVPRDAGTLYQELAPAVLGYLRSQGAPEPEDLMAEVFVQVVRDLVRFRGDDRALRRWVFSIAHNRLIDDRRRRARRPVLCAAEPPDRPAVGPGTGEGGGDLDPELVAALSTLTADQRSVVVLRFVADLPVKDVARILRRRSGAVRALQHRALARLEAHLRAAHPNHDS